MTLSGLRERAQRDDGGQFRPLSTLRTLPRGWRAVLSAAQLPGALEALYPAAVEESYAHERHALRATLWPVTAHRQSGPYASAERATPAQVEATARTLCSRCLKSRLWAAKPLTQTFLSGVPGGLPCAEACTLFLSQLCQRL